jgi:hypothetical protein
VDVANAQRTMCSCTMYGGARRFFCRPLGRVDHRASFSFDKSADKHKARISAAASLVYLLLLATCCLLLAARACSYSDFFSPVIVLYQ